MVSLYIHVLFGMSSEMYTAGVNTKPSFCQIDNFRTIYLFRESKTCNWQEVFMHGVYYSWNSWKFEKVCTTHGNSNLVLHYILVNYENGFKRCRTSSDYKNICLPGKYQNWSFPHKREILFAVKIVIEYYFCQWTPQPTSVYLASLSS